MSRLKIAGVVGCVVLAGCFDDKHRSSDPEDTSNILTPDTLFEFDTTSLDADAADDTSVADTAPAPDTLGEDTTPADTGGLDTVDNDTLGDAVSDTSELGDTGSLVDAADATDTSGPTVDSPWGLACDDAGGPGCGCDGGCADGLTCATTVLGSICAEPCNTTCTNGNRCASVADGFNICIPPFAVLCSPCRTNTDCAEVGSRCIDFGFDGSFCGAPCGDGDTCPTDYTCYTLGSGDDATKQCLPDAGSCDCSEVAISLGAATTCFVEGASDCDGERSCGPGGLSECDAPEPQPELCNGLDDNCDGEIDEGFDVGVACAADAGGCMDGLTVCAPDGASVICEGGSGQSSETLCDGADDNCNGVIDEGCDDDGDGYCDIDMTFAGSPECPSGGNDCDDTEPTVNPGGTETCDNLDNDCDGSTDGISESCAGQCGNGTRSCAAGSWTACSGPGQLCDPAQACCQSNGCAYEAGTKKCSDTATTTEKRCSGTCSGTVQQRQRFKYCTGTTANCGSANLKWSAWANSEACGSGNLCSGGGNASCTDCPMGCASGACITQPTRKICIDPAYSVNSPGPAVNGLIGKDVTWDMAQHLKTWLEDDTNKPQGGGTWSVVLTRTATSNPSQSARTATCNNAGADRMITIAVNGCCGNSASGTETHRKATSTAAWVDFAARIQEEVHAEIGLNNRGVKTSTFTTLTTSTMPSVWVFPVFMDNTTDAAKINTSAKRKTVAKGMLHGIQRSFGYSAYTP